MSTEVVKVDPRGQLIRKFAEKYGVDPGQVGSILKATAFSLPAKQGQPPQQVSNEEMAALLIVADQYGLNPFTKEIYAFPDKKGGIVPVVGVDGWSHIVNEHPAMDGIDFRYSENMVTPPDGKPCPEWIEAVVYRKDRSRPIVVREYLDECYRSVFVLNNGHKLPGPWQSHTKRMLRHKALIQGGRVAFGFSGIYDQDEAGEIVDITPQTRGLTFAETIDIGNIENQFWCAFPDVDKTRMAEYLEATAAANKADRAAVMQAAIESAKGFQDAFGKWMQKNYPPPVDKPKATKSRKPAEPAQQAEPEPETPPVEAYAADGALFEDNPRPWEPSAELCDYIGRSLPNLNLKGVLDAIRSHFGKDGMEFQEEIEPTIVSALAGGTIKGLIDKARGL